MINDFILSGPLFSFPSCLHLILFFLMEFLFLLDSLSSCYVFLAGGNDPLQVLVSLEISTLRTLRVIRLLSRLSLNFIFLGSQNSIDVFVCA